MTNNEPVVLTREHAETLYATNYDKWPQTRDPLDDLRRGRTVVVPADELARLRAEVEKYRGGIHTHGPECWSWGWRHYECAEREIARLRSRVAELEAAEPVAMFDATRLPPPDDYGFFSHPDIYSIFGDDECDQGETAARLAALGWEAYYVSGEDLVNEDTLEYNLKGWRPEPPRGDGWRQVSAFDTEDGPYAMFVRPLYLGPQRMTEAQAREAFDKVFGVHDETEYKQHIRLIKTQTWLAALRHVDAIAGEGS